MCSKKKSSGDLLSLGLCIIITFFLVSQREASLSLFFFCSAYNSHLKAIQKDFFPESYTFFLSEFSMNFALLILFYFQRFSSPWMPLSFVAIVLLRAFAKLLSLFQNKEERFFDKNSLCRGLFTLFNQDNVGKISIIGRCDGISIQKRKKWQKIEKEATKKKGTEEEN